MYKSYSKTAIVELWLKINPLQRKSDVDILLFYTYLQRQHEHLLLDVPCTYSDGYQWLKSFLRFDRDEYD